MDMQQLLAIENVAQRNVVLKRAFNFATLPIGIDGFERKAVIILVNITIKLQEKSNVLSQATAKQVMADTAHIEQCLSTLEYLQTHNLKHPDTRCRGVIRALDDRAYPKGFVRVENVNGCGQFDWSHNSADINRCLLFGAPFVLNGVVTTMANELSNGNSKITSALVALGMQPALLTKVTDCFKHLQNNVFPPSVEHPQLKQVRVPLPNGEFIAVTPVSSYLLQRDIHIACQQKTLRFAVINHAHSASVGALVAATGGKVRVLNYPAIKLHWPLRLLKPRMPFLEKNEWRQIFLYLAQRSQADTFVIRETAKREFNLALQKLITRWLQLQQVSDDITALSHQFHHWLSTLSVGHKLAYHPGLLQPVVNCLKRIQPTIIEQPTTVEGYLVLPNLVVSHANAMACSCLCGVPALNAFDGFITNYLRRLSSLSGQRVGHKGFAVCFHQFAIQRSSISRERVSKSKSRFATPTVQDDRSCHFTVSLVIAITNASEIGKSVLLAALPSRLAGGTAHLPIVAAQKVAVVSTGAEAVSIVVVDNNGYWLVDDRANFGSFANKTTLAELAAYLNNNANSCPVVGGMLLLDKPKARHGSFEGLPHAFVEPMITVAKCQSAVKYEEVDQLFWHRRWKQNATFFTNHKLEAHDETG